MKTGVPPLESLITGCSRLRDLGLLMGLFKLCRDEGRWGIALLWLFTFLIPFNAAPLDLYVVLLDSERSDCSWCDTFIVYHVGFRIQTIMDKDHDPY